MILNHDNNLTVDIVVDLQFGSTAKGKISAQLAKENKYTGSMRVQSIQAGHTIWHEGKKFVMRTIPCAWVDPNVKLYVGPGAFIEKELLEHEVNMIEDAGYSVKDRLFVDYRATWVTTDDSEAETDKNSNDLVTKIGSTGEGSGASLIRKLMRGGMGPVQRAGDDDFVRNLTGNPDSVTDVLQMIANGSHECILVEGAQGTLLSVHTSPYFPFTTSRECTVAGIMSECGLPVQALRDVYGVFRTFPIRVGGNSGPTGAVELTWEDIDRISGKVVPREKTTVTKRVRRIFEFSDEDFQHSCFINRPTKLVVAFADYLDHRNHGVSKFEDLQPDTVEWIRDKVMLAGALVSHVSTGPKEEDIVKF
jgi:adenylosuccinate synthase